MEREPLYRHELAFAYLTILSFALILASFVALLLTHVNASRLFIVALFAIFSVRDTLFMRHRFATLLGLLQLTAAAFLFFSVSSIFPEVQENMRFIFFAVFLVSVLISLVLRMMIHREYFRDK